MKDEHPDISLRFRHPHLETMASELCKDHSGETGNQGSNL